MFVSLIEASCWSQDDALLPVGIWMLEDRFGDEPDDDPDLDPDLDVLDPDDDDVLDPADDVLDPPDTDDGVDVFDPDDCTDSSAIDVAFASFSNTLTVIDFEERALPGEGRLRRQFVCVGPEELATDRQVHDQVEFLVERRPVLLVDVPEPPVKVDIQDLVPIKERLQSVRRPVQPVQMELGRQVHRFVVVVNERLDARTLELVVRWDPAIVDRRRERGRIVTRRLDEVNLTARCPVAMHVLGGQHPQRRPQVLALRHSCTNLNPSVSPRRPPLCPNTPRRVLLLGNAVFRSRARVGRVGAEPIRMSFGVQKQPAFVDVDVPWLGCVALQLLAPAVGFDLPFRAVQRVAVELVLPDQPVTGFDGPVAGWQKLGWCRGQVAR